MDSPYLTDADVTRHSLLLRLRAGGAEREIAWREFFGRYAPIIGGFARKLGVRSQDIPDVVQEVLVGFVSALPTFEYDRSRGRFRGYLKTCAWRTFRRRLGSDAFRLDGNEMKSLHPDDAIVEQAWGDVWETAKLQQALEQVRNRYSQRPDKARTFQAFNQYVLLQRAAADVASDLGMDIQSVHQAKTRISQAIGQAMKELDSTFE